MNIIEATHDPDLFAPWLDRGDWSAWRSFLAALFGLEMTDAERAIYEACTGRTDAPTGSQEAWCIVGRRGGKSFITALVGAYLAAFVDYRPYLQPGERAMVAILACDRRQARVIFRYLSAFFDRIPMLAALVDRQGTEELELGNRVTVEVATASFRSTRGYTLAAVLADETAFWRSEESAQPDSEILAALRPGMATIPTSRMICIGSPYARRGAMWQAHQKHYGKADVLVWKAPSRTMNPSLPQKVVDEAMQRDEAAARAEFLAEFRSDIERVFTHEAVDACIAPGRRELPPVEGVTYRGFVDPSGGSSDSMTLAIAHIEDGVAVLDCTREVRPPFSPEAVVKEFAATLKLYRISTVVGDRYAGEWPRERFRVHGIHYQVASQTRSDLYAELLPSINSQSVELLDDDRLRTQLIGLERRTSRTKIVFDHAPGSHDDLANSVAGALSRASLAAAPALIFEALFDEPDAAAYDAPVVRIGW